MRRPSSRPAPSSWPTWMLAWQRPDRHSRHSSRRSKHSSNSQRPQHGAPQRHQCRRCSSSARHRRRHRSSSRPQNSSRSRCRRRLRPRRRRRRLRTPPARLPLWRRPWLRTRTLPRRCWPHSCSCRRWAAAQRRAACACVPVLLGQQLSPAFGAAPAAAVLAVVLCSRVVAGCCWAAKQAAALPSSCSCVCGSVCARTYVRAWPGGWPEPRTVASAATRAEPACSQPPPRLLVDPRQAGPAGRAGR